MIKPYEPIIQEVLTQLQQELDSDLPGVLLVGSLASGTPRLQNDIDLFIDQVLEPLGGRLTEWQTPKEPV